MPMHRLVLTGGPCSGKSTGLNYLRAKFYHFGYSVIVVPEIATQLIISGVSPQTLLARQSRKDYLLFEETMIKKQISDERHYANILRAKGGEKQVLLMDRGIMDAAAYLKEKEFVMLCLKNHWNLTNLCENRYDAVFHLVTAADDKKKYYNINNNPARYETPEQACKQDKKLQKVWRRHPNFVVIDNSTLFVGKMERLWQAVQEKLIVI
jgi:predicted ATPase